MPISAANLANDEINLKDQRLAAFLAWLIPGLGHLYQGRTGKGILFFVCIVGTFLYGLYLGDGRVVYASTPILSRWQYFCQVGVGLPALPAVVQKLRADDGKPPLLGDNFERPPRMQGDFTSVDQSHHTVSHPDELAKWNHDGNDMFEMGTVYTVIAGLLNILVICDAYGGPLVIFPPDDKLKPKEPKSGRTVDQ
ncbi:MAG TPA: DUF6677 family protein [Lacipirellulaceae bacterium]|jgi:hypothetical protein